MQLGDRLRYLREKKGLKQTEFAERLRIPNQNVSNYERGFRQPDYETLKRFAEYFEVTTDYLLGHSDTPHMTEDQEFEAFAKDPDLKRWYRALPENDEEDLRRLRDMWEIIKRDPKRK